MSARTLAHSLAASRGYTACRPCLRAGPTGRWWRPSSEGAGRPRSGRGGPLGCQVAAFSKRRYFLPSTTRLRKVIVVPTTTCLEAAFYASSFCVNESCSWLWAPTSDVLWWRPLGMAAPSPSCGVSRVPKGAEGHPVAVTVSTLTSGGRACRSWLSLGGKCHTWTCHV